MWAAYDLGEGQGGGDGGPGTREQWTSKESARVAYGKVASSGHSLRVRTLFSH